MPIDPRLNCAGQICCGPPPGLTSELNHELNQEAHLLRVAILMDLGVPEELAYKVSAAMVDKQLVFMPQALANIIREIAFPTTA